MSSLLGQTAKLKRLDSQKQQPSKSNRKNLLSAEQLTASPAWRIGEILNKGNSSLACMNALGSQNSCIILQCGYDSLTGKGADDLEK